MRRRVMRALISGRAAIVLACMLTAVYLGVHARDAERVERANELGLAGRYDAAAAEAGRVRTSPADVRALLAEANAHHAAGRLARASDAFARLADRDPNNWIVHSEWARVLVALGDLRSARARFARARQLNPHLAAPPGLGG